MLLPVGNILGPLVIWLVKMREYEFVYRYPFALRIIK